MSTVDVNALLEERDPAEPCGPNLEYDPAFLELEKEIQGKPEVQYGATITPAVPPDWKVVRKSALAMLGRSLDLRIITPLLRASLALEGVSGMAACITLIERLLEERWDSVHPQLDPDDDNDPMLRINSLAMLVDSVTVLREVRDTAMIVLPGLGPISVRDLDVINGELPALPGAAKLTMASVEAALKDVPVDQVIAVHDALSHAYDSVRAIETLLVKHVGSSQALNLDPLTRLLGRGRDFIAAAVPVAAEPVVEEAADGDADAGAPVAGAAGPARAAGISGDINSRDDVLKMIDKICSYYARCEPSSPVPLLLQRVRGLVPKNFFELLEELAPDGINHFTVLSGPRKTV